MLYSEKFKNSINKLKIEGSYRFFNEIQRCAGKHPKALWKRDHNNTDMTDIIVWCSNDYLGMSQNELVISKMINSIKTMGVGSGGTRNISGNSVEIVNLENEIAALHNKEKAMVFTSGYIANEATISTLLNILDNSVVFSDEKNHASIISGIKKSSARKEIFKHNDLDHLEELIKKYPDDTNKLIVFESVYSMDGDFGNIEGIIKIAKKHNALTFLDEVHAVGMYGDTGAGVADKLGLANDIDIIQGTLGKAYGTIGGYISSTNLICDVIRSYASGFIFTTAIPPALASAANASIQYLKKSKVERTLQQENTILLKKYLYKAKIPFLDNESHIVPVMVYNPKKCKEISNILLNDFGHYIQPINYPTVPMGLERLRITPGPLHNEEMIANLTNALKHAFMKTNEIDYIKSA